MATLRSERGVVCKGFSGPDFFVSFPLLGPVDPLY